MTDTDTRAVWPAPTGLPDDPPNLFRIGDPAPMIYCPGETGEDYETQEVSHGPVSMTAFRLFDGQPDHRSLFVHGVARVETDVDDQGDGKVTWLFIEHTDGTRTHVALFEGFDQ